MLNQAIPKSEIERSVIESWLQDQMTKDVAKQGWYVNVEMGTNGLAHVIWDVAYDYRQPGMDIPFIVGTAWLDTKQNVACWRCCAIGDLPNQSNDVGFGPILPRVERNSKAKGEHFGTGNS